LRQIADALDREPSRSRLRAALATKDVGALSTIALGDTVPTLTAPTIRLLARALLLGANPDLASQLLLAARRRFPQDFALAMECARALRLCKPPRSAEAVAQYEAALALRPQGIEIWHEFGQTLVNELGRGAEGVALFRQAVERAPDDGHLHFHLGHALTLLGRHAEAIECYRRSLELSPDYPIALLDLGISLDALGRTQEAVESFQRGIALDPTSALAHYNLAVSLVTLGRDEEALASYQRAAELGPTLVHVHLNIGNTLGRLNRLEEALPHYRRELETDVEDGYAHYYLGWTLNRLGRDREAIDEVRRAVELRPGEALWNRYLAWMLATTEHEDLRDLAGALAYARRAVELEPNNGDYVGVLGVASYTGGDFSAAREHLLRAVDLAGANGVRVLFLALSEAHLGDSDTARDHFEQIAPRFDELIRVFPSLKRFVQEARDLAAKQG
jgi:tetratricopeptide (TPR) repeat protein